MPRPVQPLGTYGKITVSKSGSMHCATTRYRGFDGAYHRFEARDEKRQAAINALKSKIATYVETGAGDDLTGQSKLSEVADLWLDEIVLRDKIAPQTVDRYRDRVNDIVLPALGELRLTELTVGTLDRYFKALATRAAYPESTDALMTLGWLVSRERWLWSGAGDRPASLSGCSTGVPVAPARWGWVVPGGLLLVRVDVGDTAHDQTAGDVLGCGLCGERNLGDFGLGDPRVAFFVVDQLHLRDALRYGRD